jgi:hypothetical protein
VVLTLVGLIPILGGIVSVLAAAAGLGALVMTTTYRARRGPAPMASVESASQSVTAPASPIPA